MTWRSASESWRGGPWELELRDDELADISFRGRPVLRSVRAVVRDRNWDTARLVVDHVRRSDTTLMLSVHSEGLGSSFQGVVRVVGHETHLDILTDLESARPFATNRTGLVVLHPPWLAGERLDVTHSDRSLEVSTFPRAISPHQPVFDIAGLSWQHAGLQVTVDFEGDVFEMEDQRNWSDASYKTYSRPLALPFPYEIAAGERVRQSVRIAVDETDAAPASRDDDAIRLEVDGPMFELALGAATGPDPAPAGARQTTAAMLVELDLRTPNWRAALTRTAASGAPIDVRVIAPAGMPFDPVAHALAALPGAVRVARVGAFDATTHVTDAAALAALRDALHAAGVRAPLVGGTRAHFTELNREWDRVPRDLDGVAFSTTPLFHALGTEQLVESLAMQRAIARQAAVMAAGSPVHVGPVTLRARFNNVATSLPPLPPGDDLAAGYGAEFTGADDDRQAAPELAAWTVASAAALGVPGVASIAFFEEWGPRGIRSTEGDPLPVAAAIDALHEIASSDARLLWGDSPDGLVWAVGARSAAGDVLLVANLDDRPREITVSVGSASETVAVGPTAFRRVVLTR